MKKFIIDYWKYFCTALFGAFFGAWIFAFQVASNTFDVKTIFGTVHCFKLDGFKLKQ